MASKRVIDPFRVVNIRNVPDTSTDPDKAERFRTVLKNVFIAKGGICTEADIEDVQVNIPDASGKYASVQFKTAALALLAQQKTDGYEFSKKYIFKSELLSTSNTRTKLEAEKANAALEQARQLRKAPDATFVACSKEDAESAVASILSKPVKRPGILGFKTLLMRYCVPDFIALSSGDSRLGYGPGQLGKLLIIDGPSLLEHLLRLDDGDSPAALYANTLHWLGMLAKCGLECVVVCDGGASVRPDGSAFVERFRGDAAIFDPRITLAFSLAIAELKEHVRCVQALGSSTFLCVAMAKEKKSEIFAVLTGNSDFFVYDVVGVVLLSDVSISKNGVSVHKYLVSKCWNAMKGVTSVECEVSTLQRAQCASFLTNQIPAILRERISSRTALASLLSLDKVDNSVFIKNLGITAWSASDMTAFEAIVNEYRSIAELAGPGTSGLLNFQTAVTPWLGALGAHLRNGSSESELFLRLFTSVLFTGVLVLRATSDVVLGILADIMPRLLPGLPVYVYSIKANTIYQVTARSTESLPSGWAFHLDGPICTGAKLANIYDSVSKVCVPSGVDPLVAIRTLVDTSVGSPEVGNELAFVLSLLHHASVLPIVEPWSIRVEYLMPTNFLEVADQLRQGRETVALERPFPAEKMNIGLKVQGSDWEDMTDGNLLNSIRESSNYRLVRALKFEDEFKFSPSSSVAIRRLFSVLTSMASKTGSSKAKKWYGCLEVIREKLCTCGRPVECVLHKTVADSNAYTEFLISTISEKKKIGKEEIFVPKEDKLEYTALEALFLRWASQSTVFSSVLNVEMELARTHWECLPREERQKAVLIIHSSRNNRSTSAFGDYIPYRHQYELLYLVKNNPNTPTATILSTPTGSGKTFSALLLYLRVLKEDRLDLKNVWSPPGPLRRNKILIYCVPSKAVLKRVGSDFAAQYACFWTIAAKPDALVPGQMSYEVRRPWNIRTKKKSKQDLITDGYSQSSGPIISMLLQVCDMAQQYQDDNYYYNGPGSDYYKGAATDNGDRCSMDLGKPDVIICEMAACAALLQAIGDESNFTTPCVAYNTQMKKPASYMHPSVSKFHWKNFILFFDEPNYGLFMDKECQEYSKTIVQNMPMTTILASATLPHWNFLPTWWQGERENIRLTVITHPSFELPVCELRLLSLPKMIRSNFSLDNVEVEPEAIVDMSDGLGDAYLEEGKEDASLGQAVAVAPPVAMVAPTLPSVVIAPINPEDGGFLRRVSVLDLFPSYKAFSEFFGSNTGSLRHQSILRLLSHEHSNDLAKLRGGLGDLGSFSALRDSAADMRERFNASMLANLTKNEFTSVKGNWEDSKPKSINNIRDAIGKNGITLVATLKVEDMARELSGYTTLDQFKTAQKDMLSRIKGAKEALRRRGVAARACGRAVIARGEDRPEQNRENDEAIGVWAGGVNLSIEEAEELGPASLVLLSKGIVFAHENANAGMVKQFQKTILNISEKHLNTVASKGGRPAIYIVVVDYSGIYGLDCPAVSTLILCNDLGRYLSPGDLLQFIGRLRNDGEAIFCSNQTLESATVEFPREDWANSWKEAVQSIVGPYAKYTLKEAEENAPETATKLCLAGDFYIDESGMRPSKLALAKQLMAAVLDNAIFDMHKLGNIVPVLTELALDQMDSASFCKYLLEPILDENSKYTAKIAEQKAVATATKLYRAGLFVISEKGAKKLKIELAIQVAKLLLASKQSENVVFDPVKSFANVIPVLCSFDLDNTERVALLNTVETIVLSPEWTGRTGAITKLLVNMYNQDLLDDDTINEYIAQSSLTRMKATLEVGSHMAIVAGAIADFVKWANEADEEN